jgi:hypothetical protein
MVGNWGKYFFSNFSLYTCKADLRGSLENMSKLTPKGLWLCFAKEHSKTIIQIANCKNLIRFYFLELQLQDLALDY